MCGLFHVYFIPPLTSTRIYISLACEPPFSFFPSDNPLQPRGGEQVHCGGTAGHGINAFCITAMRWSKAADQRASGLLSQIGGRAFHPTTYDDPQVLD